MALPPQGELKAPVDDSRQLLDDLPVLRLLPAEARKLVVDSFVPAAVPFGAPIIREGEPADALYVLVSGRARVVKRADNGEELSLGALKPGDSFGEMGLLEETIRSATVRASSEVEVLRLDRSVFRALVQRHPEIRQHFELQVRHRALQNFFRLYSAFARLPVPALQLMLAELEPVTVKPGELIIRQSDEAGPMYIVEAGRVPVFVQGG